MSSFRKLTLAVAISSTVALAGCVDDDDDNDDGGVVSTGETISGTATAPAGVIGRLETRNLFEIAAEFFISPAAATISGLAPIQDAEVELIRVDDQGNQVGEVLASTTTSTEGVYELTLPQGVNLAGNLVVRINGANQSLRAQVVDHDVDISPVSEFILTKFLETGAHLGQLQLDEVASLSDKVEEFDMDATGLNLDQTFGILETEVGDFVENKVAVVAGGKGDAGSVAGDYRSVSFSLEMSDSDDNQYGSYGHSVGASTYSFAGGGEGAVTITLNDEEDIIDGSLVATSINTPPFSLGHETSSSTAVNETFSGTLTQSGILSVESDFEEELDVDEGWRWPAMVNNLVQAGDNGTFIAQTNEAAVRYGLIDTNDDNEPDALDPDTKLGDEISRSMEFFARQPTGFEVAALQDAVFGAVFIGSELETDSISLETQVNTVTFGGGGTVTVSAVTEDHGHFISQTPAGPEYAATAEVAETGIPLVISDNGDIVSVGEEPADGFINEAEDFIAIYEGEGESDNYSSVGLTLMTKLPATQPSVAGKRFRMQLMSMTLDSQDSQPEFLLSSSKFNTFLTMGSETEGTLDGTLDGSLLEVGRTGLAGPLSVDTARLEAVSVDTEIGANGATTLTISDDGDTTILDGFFNEDASLGVFALRSLPEGGEPNELGLVVLAAPTPSEE
ncbi:MAG: hypothetical protein SV598_01395 [Pseudomonadota bacterium]|nr:hypothetical protein [Pseudomonadota bacterium]